MSRQITTSTEVKHKNDDVIGDNQQRCYGCMRIFKKLSFHHSRNRACEELHLQYCSSIVQDNGVHAHHGHGEPPSKKRRIPNEGVRLSEHPSPDPFLIVDGDRAAEVDAIVKGRSSSVASDASVPSHHGTLTKRSGVLN